MLKKKIIALCLVATALLVGCGSKATDGAGSSTNTSAQEEQAKFTGTKTYETLYDATGKKGDVIVASVDFEDGVAKKVSIDVRQENGTMKKAESAAGNYVMVEGEDKAWHEQIELLENFLNENGCDVSKVTLTGDKGNTDAVTGVSIKVAPYLEAVQAVVDSVNNGTELEEGFTGAVEGTVEPAADSNKKDVTIAKVVFNHGKPVSVNIDVKLEDGTMKKKLSSEGGYVMKEGEEKAWHEQIADLEAFIVENDFDLSKITLTDDDGHTDAVSGVSIKVGTYLEAVQNALDEAK